MYTFQGLGFIKCFNHCIKAGNLLTLEVSKREYKLKENPNKKSLICWVFICNLTESSSVASAILHINPETVFLAG